jgi:hypothetical protein
VERSKQDIAEDMARLHAELSALWREWSRTDDGATPKRHPNKPKENVHDMRRAVERRVRSLTKNGS